MTFSELLDVLAVNNLRAGAYRKGKPNPTDTRYIYLEITGFGKVGDCQVQEIYEGRNGTSIRLLGKESA